MSVLVLGATGTVGPHVVRALLSRGEPTRVLTRDPRRAREILPAGAVVVEGDPEHDDVLLDAAAGVRAVFLLSSHGRRMADVQLGIIRALRRQAVRIVKLSGTSTAITPDGPHACRQHWEVEQVLAASGAVHVILRPNAFMQTLVDQTMLPAARSGGTVPNALGAAGLSMISARDVGDCAAVALTDPRWDGQILRLTGPRSVTVPEVAELISVRIGHPVTVTVSTPAAMRRVLADRGMPTWEAEHFEEMYRLFRSGRSESVTDDVRRLLGHGPIDLTDHLADLLARPTPQNSSGDAHDA
ncbi:NmrA family NAD(P)-binding protein [Umezawaea sp. Da 62-37]|uniref:NmrA family NAD(P)-binding protein n=1 Tax=Umezawaea sp. Da 62-37 TaxID=3075927 RepID=UPI0028F6E093|nr:NmrA family NAD(P)-binding protein [Umezawaea sp. Da 62-37]WNV83009.1 NmrA family NAD(P)-binding protein [Umezawaea sp. Da 62-37]